MKLATGLILFILMTTQSFAYTMQQLEGKYKVSSKMLRVENFITLNQNGWVKLTDKSGSLSCKGPSTLSKNIITTTITCKNTPAGMVPFKFVIDLSKITNLNQFTANLTIPMVGESPWEFERLEN